MCISRTHFTHPQMSTTTLMNNLLEDFRSLLLMFPVINAFHACIDVWRAIGLKLPLQPITKTSLKIKIKKL